MQIHFSVQSQCILWREAADRAWSTVTLLFFSCLSNGAANHPCVQAFIALEGEDKESSSLEFRGDSDATAFIQERPYNEQPQREHVKLGKEGETENMCEKLQGVG